MLNENLSLRKIADVLDYNVTSISREIFRNRKFVKMIDGDRCKHIAECRCSKTKCRTCPNYEEDICEKLLKAPWVCEGCKNLKQCRKNRYRYQPKEADQYANQRWIEAREQYHTSLEDIERINNIITPLVVNQHQSLSHIYTNHRESLGVSISTLYRLVDDNKLIVKNIDLPRRIRYRKERKKRLEEEKRLSKHRINRTIQDFEAFSKKHKNASVYEFDTVIGERSGDHKVLLTILLRKSNFMLIFLLNRKTSKRVVDKFDSLYRKLGFADFKSLFYIGLTDNGSEMLDVEGLEKGTEKNKKTHIFYCDSRASQQKGKLERNHEYIRLYIPQGKNFDHLDDLDIKKMVNHINSVARPQFDNKTPFQMLSRKEKKIISKLGYKEVDPDKVNLNPKLFHK